jgi:hypothetical protein
VGYIWVVAFLAWSTPIWSYPIRMVNREDKLLTVEALNPFWANLFQTLLKIGENEISMTYPEGHVGVHIRPRYTVGLESRVGPRNHISLANTNTNYEGYV